MRTGILLIVLVLIGIGAFTLLPSEKEEVSSFEECVKAGYSIQESYPRKCTTPQGGMFTEDIGNELEMSDMIRVDSPRPNQEISSPLSIEGQAREEWFSGAGFLVALLDESGAEIATSRALAQEGRTQEGFIPFTAELSFGVSEEEQGRLILRSGSEELVIPVRLTLSEGKEVGECRPTGCSSHVCASEEVVATCEWKEEYACYRLAVCERQESGECGWTMTRESAQCFEDVGR